MIRPANEKKITWAMEYIVAGFNLSLNALLLFVLFRFLAISKVSG